MAPTAKEKVSTVKVRNFMMESLLLSSKAPYNSCPTVRRFPVQIVVL